MASLNKVMLIGNLGKDPETKHTPSGLQITRFSVATTEKVKKGNDWEDKTEWHNITLFDKQAEYASTRLKKGNTIYLEGKIQTSSWEDESGTKKYRTEIIGAMFRILIRKDEEAGNNQSTPPSQQNNNPPASQQPNSQGSNPPPVVSDGNDLIDDLPF